VSRLVIGVGNATRGDDGVGVAVTHRLNPAGLVAHTPLELIDLWEGADEVFVVDAARSGAPPGTIHRIEVGREELPPGVLTGSTHTISVADVVALARTLGRLPRRLVIYGIEAGHLSHGETLSPEVEAAVGAVVAEVGSA
jgi:hydrogenase maturation protease